MSCEGAISAQKGGLLKGGVMQYLSGMEGVLPLLAIAGLLFAAWTYFIVIRRDEGSALMKSIADQIHMGAMVFLKREYQIIGIFMVIVFIPRYVYTSSSSNIPIKMTNLIT